MKWLILMAEWNNSLAPKYWPIQRWMDGLTSSLGSFRRKIVWRTEEIQGAQNYQLV